MKFNADMISRRTGRRVEFYDEIDSTNAELVRRVKSGDAVIGDTVTAARQSAGRGRRGNSFSSPDGGIYFSFVAENKKGALVTVKSGVAVASALESLGFSPEIKWVNDVLLGGKKVCGILAEAVAGTGLCVVGIGINLKSDSLPEELHGIASALDVFGEVPDADELVCRVLERYDGVTRDVIGEYKKYMKMLGRRVTLKQTGETATAYDVTPLGELTVEFDDGRISTLNSGEISIRIN